MLLKVYSFFEITYQYLFFFNVLTFKLRFFEYLSQETVLRHATIDMLMKMGCGNTFGKLPWPDVHKIVLFLRNIFAFSKKRSLVIAI